ncbi:Uncharacterised protein [Yersinia pseudotuberculosis]|uniref:DUF6708 domain-containing protein n=1 Tax=Yersinia pekkanenii TaxID=1288385 RepID=A0A0T9RBJ4_9GAMM|nr:MULTISPECIES: DUF6708 domain-containing protein [Yersinia]AJJ06893.1 hypothetical protein BZ20_2919 [Yersinia pseudotuberculosis]MBO1556571.1 hypothetical protein [Yersinia pseudotuberculosis]MBO1561325.1 hypothetical protein [Yersinia pseudotuberculosis]CNI52231.1 Uncharacterised protein [Yersinia pekkanenii]CNK16599.1 Uncharacterised protein [Yersinia pseudotuberculosis]
MGKLKRRQQKQPQQILPRLIPPVKSWSEDLPDLAEQQQAPPQLIRVNEINDIWMEIPRYVNHGWFGLWFMAFFALFSFCFCLLFSPSLTASMFSGVSVFIFSCLLLIPFVSLIVFFFKSILFEPRGAPVRFNRKRQKVYVYEYQRSSWNPWSRWYPVIKVFDWADIHAERVLMAGHADWGHRIYCGVCKPGTYEVVDRFVLTWSVGSIYDAYGLWSHCCHYMQAKPVPTAPLLTDVPLNWTPFKTVRWPEALDKESTTAPD